MYFLFLLKNINPDYVFYERPYSSYLPMEYKISTVSKYAKTCYLPYGYEMMNYIFDTSLNVDFFRYLHIFFADSYVTESFNKTFFNFITPFNVFVLSNY